MLRTRPATQAVPIIMLTARTTESDRVSGLDAGADDYVTKPFSLRELAARVRAVLRRGRGDDASRAAASTAAQHLVADFDAVPVTVDGAAVRLTRREFELLRYLVENRNRVISRDRLLERVWGYDRLDRDPLGRRARRPPARQARRRRPADRDRRRPRLPVRRVGSPTDSADEPNERVTAFTARRPYSGATRTRRAAGMRPNHELVLARRAARRPRETEFTLGPHRTAIAAPRAS